MGNDDVYTLVNLNIVEEVIEFEADEDELKSILSGKPPKTILSRQVKSNSRLLQPYQNDNHPTRFIYQNDELKLCNKEHDIGLLRFKGYLLVGSKVGTDHLNKLIGKYEAALLLLQKTMDYEFLSAQEFQQLLKKIEDFLENNA